MAQAEILPETAAVRREPEMSTAGLADLQGLSLEGATGTRARGPAQPAQVNWIAPAEARHALHPGLTKLQIRCPVSLAEPFLRPRALDASDDRGRDFGRKETHDS